MQTPASRPLLICLGLALVARLAFVFVVFPAVQPRMHLREDGDGYGQIAQTIRDGHYDDVSRGPVYPMFLALAGSPSAAKCFQAILDTVTVWLVFLLAGRNWKAAALWAVYPFAIWRVAFINKEVVLGFLLVSYVCVQLLAFRSRKLWPWLAAGGLLAVVNLCKPTFLAWPVAVLALAYLHRVPLSRVAILIAGMILVVAPWTWRNYRGDAWRVCAGGDRAGRGDHVHRELPADAWSLGGPGKTTLDAGRPRHSNTTWGGDRC